MHAEAGAADAFEGVRETVSSPTGVMVAGVSRSPTTLRGEHRPLAARMLGGTGRRSRPTSRNWRSSDRSRSSPRTPLLRSSLLTKDPFPLSRHGGQGPALHSFSLVDLLAGTMIMEGFGPGGVIARGLAACT